MDFEIISETEKHRHGDTTVSEINKVMHVTFDEAQMIISLAAEVHWDTGLDEGQQELVDRIVESFPGITVPDILVHS